MKPRNLKRKKPKDAMAYLAEGSSYIRKYVLGIKRITRKCYGRKKQINKVLVLCECALRCSQLVDKAITNGERVMAARASLLMVDTIRELQVSFRMLTRRKR